MNRRSILRRTATIGVVGLAGCLGSDDGELNPGTGGADGGGGGPGTEQPTVGTPSAVADFGIETTNTDCDSGSAGEASVTFDDAAGAVAVGGTIQAGTPCHRAQVAYVRYQEGVISTAIIAIPEGGEDACAQCVGAIEYDATVTMRDDLPGEVVVYHGSGDEETEVARTTRS